MNLIKTTFTLVVILLGTLTSVPALAHHGHHGSVRFGVFVGAPAFWYYPSPYYYPPYYYSPAVAVVPSSPPTYVEQGSAQAAPEPSQASQYWYYCPESKIYYPYIKQCPGGWQRVVPQPPNS
jgi:hypothetical protein